MRLINITFATILAVFLLTLALGSVLANALCRTKASPVVLLIGLMGAGGLAVAVTPILFYRLTSGMEYLGSGKGWI